MFYKLSNYPPGVTGNEPQIAGYPPCQNPRCRHDLDEHEDDGPCMVEGCLCGEYEQFPRERDPDLRWEQRHA